MTPAQITRIHIEDKDFALDEGLIPARMGQGNIPKQFRMLADYAEIPEKQTDAMMALKTDVYMKNLMFNNLLLLSYLCN